MSVFRGVIVGLAIEAAAALIILGACTATAHAATPQQRLDQTANWLTQTLHRPIPTRTLRITNQAEMTRMCGEEACDAFVPFTHPETVVTTSDVADTWGWRPRWWDPAVIEANHLMRHELLHTHNLTPGAPFDWWVEEGIVEAVNTDLDAAWCQRHLHATCVVAPYYPDRVAAIRAASAKATGSLNWRVRYARLWRRELLAADEEGRRRMLEEVNR